MFWYVVFHYYYFLDTLQFLPWIPSWCKSYLLQHKNVQVVETFVLCVCYLFPVLLHCVQRMLTDLFAVFRIHLSFCIYLWLNNILSTFVNIPWALQEGADFFNTYISLKMLILYYLVIGIQTVIFLIDSPSRKPSVLNIFMHLLIILYSSLLCVDIIVPYLVLFSAFCCKFNDVWY